MSGCMNFFSGCLSSYNNLLVSRLDFFKTQITVNNNGQTHQNSRLGFLMSLLTVILLILYSLYLLATNGTPIVTNLLQYSNTSYPLFIYPSNFTFAISITQTTSSGSSPMSLSNAFFNVNFYLQTQTNGQIQTTPLGTRPCDINDYIASFVVEPGNFFCPAYSSTLTIFGGSSEDSSMNSQVIIATITPCQSNSNITCQSPSAINNILQTSTLTATAAYYNSFYTGTQANGQVNNFLESQDYLIDIQLSKTLMSFYSIQEIISQGSFIESETVESYGIKSDLNFYDFESFMGTYFSMVLGVSNYKQQFIWNYLTYSELLSSLGGMLNMLTLGLGFLVSKSIGNYFYARYASNFIKVKAPAKKGSIEMSSDISTEEKKDKKKKIPEFNTLFAAKNSRDPSKVFEFDKEFDKLQSDEKTKLEIFELEKLKRLVLGSEEKRLFDIFSKVPLDHLDDKDEKKLMEFSQEFLNFMKSIEQRADTNRMCRAIFTYQGYLKVKMNLDKDPINQKLIEMSDPELISLFEGIRSALGDQFDLAKVENYFVAQFNS